MNKEAAEKYLTSRMAMSRSSTTQDKYKYYLVIGGTAFLMAFALIITK